jgi:hypothetical protein
VTRGRDAAGTGGAAGAAPLRRTVRPSVVFLGATSSGAGALARLTSSGGTPGGAAPSLRACGEASVGADGTPRAPARPGALAAAAPSAAAGVTPLALQARFGDDPSATPLRARASGGARVGVTGGAGGGGAACSGAARGNGQRRASGGGGAALGGARVGAALEPAWALLHALGGDHAAASHAATLSWAMSPRRSTRAGARATAV